MNAENRGSCANGPNCKVLMVEDDPMLRLVTGISLEAAGIPFCAAPGGEEFLELLKSHNPRVVLMDVGMPGLNGFEIVERIKTDSAFAGHRNVTSLVHTSRDLTTDEQQRLTLGSIVIYTKTSCDNIAVVVRDLLARTEGDSVPTIC